MRLPKDFKEFIALLNAHEVKYVIVGGYAVAYHGYPRFTGDVDFFIEASRENSRKMEKVIGDFGFGETGLKASDFDNPDRIVQLGVEPNRIDIVTGIEAVEFCDAWNRRVRVELDDLATYMLDFDLLLQNKRATKRPQDMADVEQLSKRRSSGA